MELVARIWHVDDIRDGLYGQRWSALGEQICLFMLIAQEARFRGVCFAEDDMADRMKSCILPSCEERIRPGPTIKHDGETIMFQNAIGFTHRGPEPVVVDVVLDGATGAITIVH